MISMSNHAMPTDTKLEMLFYIVSKMKLAWRSVVVAAIIFWTLNFQSREVRAKTSIYSYNPYFILHCGNLKNCKIYVTEQQLMQQWIEKVCNQ